MIRNTVNLYEYYGLTPPEGAAGNLTCLAVPTSREISSRRRRPAVLVLPGGGYWFTSDREAEPVALQFLAQGYAAFVLRYTCVPQRFPTALREACMAMRYIREHAGEYEVDPAMVSAIGFSAGGHLCGTLGTLFDCPEVSDLGDAHLLRPDALGLCYPVAVSWGRTHDGSFDNLCGDDPELRRRLSLEHLVRPDMPPVFLWATRDDDAVPCRNSLILACALEEAGVDFTLHLYHRGQHGLSVTGETVYNVQGLPGISPDIPRWPRDMICFFRETGLQITDPLQTP